MTTRAEEIAVEGPYTFAMDESTSYVRRIHGPGGVLDYYPENHTEAQHICELLNAAYKQGQQDRWMPVAMIHNDYDASVRCSNCGDTGGFGVYDDLEWAKHCPGCGRPISEQVSAKGVRTPHPLYSPPNPEQR